MNAPKLLTWTMKNLFVDMMDKVVVDFLDSTLIYTYMVQEEFKLLKKVFICLYKYTFYYKLENFSFPQSVTTCLEFNTPPERKLVMPRR